MDGALDNSYVVLRLLKNAKLQAEECDRLMHSFSYDYVMSVNVRPSVCLNGLQSPTVRHDKPR